MVCLEPGATQIVTMSFETSKNCRLLDPPERAGVRFPDDAKKPAAIVRRLMDYLY